MKKFFAAVQLILTLRCEQSTKIVSASLDRDLSAAERWAVRLHYISCWSCRRFGRQIRRIREALRLHPNRTPDDKQLSADAIQRIRDAIQNEA